jgi:hypothetical protein
VGVDTGRPTSLSALVREAGILSERALVEAVAGEPVRGSWWGHSRGRAIYQALEQLREDADVFLCKLVDGKQSYIHRRLWPALLRIQAEASLWPVLSAKARTLLARVEKEGSVRATGRARLELEQALRVVARAEHTASGAHAVVLTPFLAHFSRDERARARVLTLEAAQSALAGSPGYEDFRTSRPRKGAPKSPATRHMLKAPPTTARAPRAARAMPQPLPGRPRKP